MRRPHRLGRLGASLVLALVASACVTGPITGPGDIGLNTGFDLALVDYQRSEFFVDIIADSYSSTEPLTGDGVWTVEPDGEYQLARTRMVVHRPIDPADFNGTVVVEWLNVTAGADAPPDWLMGHNEMIRRGAAWIGVSAQAVGVNSLKTQNPARYGTLVHPGDSYSYDMFTHAGYWARTNPDVLGGLVAERVLAAGESQSASRMVTYINAMHLRSHTYDGFLVHSRSGGGAALRQAPLGSVSVPSPVQIRADLDVPVMVVQAEGDVLGSYLAARQPDTALYRSWEIAGTSHADSYTFPVGFNDIGDGAGTLEMFNLMRNPLSIGCASPINAGPHYLVLQAAVAGLDDWVRTGTPPPSAPLLEFASTNPNVLARDSLGNALGGIRTPHVDVPIATLTGVNSGAGFCRLFGSTTPLTSEQLAQLYPTHEAFVAAWTDSVEAAVTAGFIPAAEAPALIAAAAASTIPD